MQYVHAKIKDLSQDRPEEGSARFRFVDIQLSCMPYDMFNGWGVFYIFLLLYCTVYSTVSHVYGSIIYDMIRSTDQ